jgi:ABC-type nitrate/sulfonate/bicarbonate transport system permease component
MHPILRLILLRVFYMVLAAIIAIIIWIIVLNAFHVSKLVGQQPWDVWNYLVAGKDAAANRATIFGFLSETARDFAIGYLIGLAVAFILAVVFSLSVTAENVIMPTAMVLRSIPVIVITPLITLLFGIGVIGVTVIVTLVVFLPALANVLFGLRASQVQHSDLVRAFGGTNLQLMRKVAVPGSLPAIMASARISVPAAVTGAMIGEWLATGDGLGGFISRSAGAFGYDGMWAAAVVVTGFTMVVYIFVSVIDALVQNRFGALR